MFCNLFLLPPFWLQTNCSAHLIFIPVVSLRSPPGTRFVNCNSSFHILLSSLYFSHFLYSNNTVLSSIPQSHPQNFSLPSTVRTTNFYVKEHFYAYYVTLLLPAVILIRWNISHLEWSEEKLTDSQPFRNEHDRKLCTFQCSTQHFHWNMQQNILSTFKAIKTQLYIFLSTDKLHISSYRVANNLS